MKKRKVAVVSAPVGGGHKAAADAIVKAYAAKYPDVEVRHLDVLNLTNFMFHWFYASLYLWMVNHATHLLGFLYDWWDHPWQRRFSRWVERWHTRRFYKEIKEFDPDLIVCTHFLPADLISWWRRLGLVSIPQAIVVTDMDAHAMWLCRDYERYFVAIDETREYLQRLGIEAGKLSVTGIPINPVFAEYKNCMEMRDKHGLRRDRPTILLSGGGHGVGPLEAQLEQLLHLKHEAQIVVICGRNEALAAKLEKKLSTFRSDTLNIKIFGFTRDMDELMAASNLIVGKPGGLTTSEALAKGLAFVIVNPIPGQEARNSDHLLEEGAGIRCNNLLVLDYKIDQLLSDPERLVSMQENSRRLGRADAAAEIAKILESGCAAPFASVGVAASQAQSAVNETLAS